MKATKEIIIGGVKIGGSNPLVLIAGPCVIENKALTFRIAKEIKVIAKRVGISFVFKASYDKANRTRIGSFRGLGKKLGLGILKEIKEGLNVPVLTDVHRVEDVADVASVVDIVQIPAFLCRQTDLVRSVAKQAKCVNLKKGQFLAPWDMRYVVEKVEGVGNSNILLTERGVSFGYNRLVVDMCSLSELREIGYPVVFDVTHSLQCPGTEIDRKEYIPYLTRAGVAYGCDAVFLEVHPDPSNALSDSQNTLALDKLEELLEDLKKISKISKKNV